jgi:glycosyltransferase involved in cell wall biosynthesis
VNRGISANLRHCFAESSGKYIAVLEGDDYWLWDSKIARQVEFMEKNPDCSMVFSRIVLMHEGRDNPAEFKRQSSLPTKLTGEDFLKDPYQNPIANFSCCMFRADVAKKFPDILFSTRFNEIACGFYIEQIGPIGFIPIAMSAYRIHSGGTWSAGGRRKNIESAIQSREIALAVAAPKYKDRIQAIIDGLKKQLKELGDA